VHARFAAHLLAEGRIGTLDSVAPVAEGAPWGGSPIWPNLVFGLDPSQGTGILTIRAGHFAGRSRCARALAPGMKISAASRVSGVSTRSLRHYEDEGLIVPGRLSNGFRDYCQSTIDRVLVIRSLLESGLPVRLIRQALPDLADGSDGGTDVLHAEFLHEVRSHRDRLAARIAILSDQHAALDAYLREARRTSHDHHLPLT
jgi:DNA-binding transcriptional MerR regulator